MQKLTSAVIAAAMLAIQTPAINLESASSATLESASSATLESTSSATLESTTSVTWNEQPNCCSFYKHADFQEHMVTLCPS